jgi:hypothetical protein
LLFADSFSITFFSAICWIFGSSEVTTLKPPRRSVDSRSAGLLPNAGCSSHQALRKSQKKP